jgi:predicted  nucleic acid-binding Zn-ribbon protein
MLKQPDKHMITSLLIVPGCATNGDIEALRTHVNNSLMQTRQQMQSRLGPLEETKKKMDAQEKQLTAALSAKQAQESRLDVLESAVKRSLEQQRLLSEDVAAVRTTVQGKDDRLLLLLDAQENLYQDGLRTLHAIRGELSGKHNQMSQPRSQAAESNDALVPQSDSIEKNDPNRPKAR